MSRIGKIPIKIPKNITISLSKNILVITGPYGVLNQLIPKELKIDLTPEIITIYQNENTLDARKKHGLLRSLINNKILGTIKKFEKKLQMVGIGYRVQLTEKTLILNAGYSHPILIKIPNNIEITIESNTIIRITGIDKEQVGLFASKIRNIRPPEPYKGKGIRYINEVVLIKPGKSIKKK